MSRKTANPYLCEFELQRVLALIGYLATHKNQSYVKLEDIAKDICILGSEKETLGKYWLKVARSHPEFFGVVSSETAIRLWARFYPEEVSKKVADQEDEAPGKQKKTRRPCLQPVRVGQLQETALKLHDAAVSLSDHRLRVQNMWVSAIFGLLGGVLAALVTCWLKGN